MTNKLIRFDWAIKKILRSKANFAILEGFLSELLKTDITIINVLESEGNKESEKDKYNRVDILVKNEKQELILIEVQVATEHDFLSRLLYGSSKVITEYMSQGAEYKEVKKVYAIGIVYFDLGQGEDYIYHGVTEFKGMHLHDELKLNNDQKLLYQREQVRDLYPEYYIIKINQFNDVAKDTLDEWIYFLKNEEIKDGFHAKGLAEAKEKLIPMKLPEHEQAKYANYLEDLHYQASMVGSSYGLGMIKGKLEGLTEGIEKGIEKGKLEGKIEGKLEGLAEGIEKGKLEGLAEGIEKGKLETARNMLKKGIDIATIAEVTGINESDLKDV